MSNSPLNRPAAAAPTLTEEDGLLSLHFAFPTIQSRTMLACPERLVLDYTRTMMGFLLFQPNPEFIGMIGLGGGSLAKYCHHKLPKADFTAIELSPEVIALRKDFGIPGDNMRFRVICDDGADYIQDKIDAFDVLLVDGFDRDGQPEQLCSLGFYDHCFAALRPNGILVINLCADDPACATYVARVHTAFSGKVLAVDADEGENKIIFAAKSSGFPPSFNLLTERLRTLESAHPVDLDLTAQKLLRQGHRQPTGRRRKNVFP